MAKRIIFLISAFSFFASFAGAPSASVAQSATRENRVDPAGVWRGSVTCDLGTVEFELTIDERTGISRYEGTYRVLSTSGAFRRVQGQDMRAGVFFDAHTRGTTMKLRGRPADTWNTISIDGNLGEDLSSFPHGARAFWQTIKGSSGIAALQT